MPAKPSSLYEPYWRQHSWYKRRYGSSETSPEPPTEHHHGTDVEISKDFSLTSVQRDSDKEITTTTTASKDADSATTYGLFRTKKISDETETGSSSSSVSETNVKKESVSMDLTTTRPTTLESVKLLRQAEISCGLSSSLSKPTPSASEHMTKQKEEQPTVLLRKSNQESAPSTSACATNGTVISEAKEDVRPLSSHLHLPQDVDGSKRLSACSVDSAVEQMLSSSSSLQSPENYAMKETVSVQWFEDGHFMLEIMGLSPDSSSPPPGDFYKRAERVSFSTDPIKVYSTHSVVEYDRRNEDIDPVSASAEYELERRLEKMDVFDVDLEKGCEGLGFSIIGMGVGADAGLEKLGIFVKSITPGGAVHNDGRIQVCDQIVEVDNQSLVGVTQGFAAAVLRSTSGKVHFRIGREKNLETSEIAMLIRQSIEQDKMRAQQQEFFQQLHRSSGEAAGSPRMSQDDADETSSATPTPSLDGEGGGFENKPLEDATSEPLVEDQPQIDQLMFQLRKSGCDVVEENTVSPIEDDEEETSVCEGLDNSSTSGVQNDNDAKADASRTEEAFHSEPMGSLGDDFTPLSGEMSQILAESLQDSAAASSRTNHESSLIGGSIACYSSGESSPASCRRSGAGVSSAAYSISAEEREIQAKIKILESQLAETKHQTSHFQDLLSDSQSHYTDLEKKYQKAKKMLKDYQDRERSLLEREEIHLMQLKEKDQQYNLLVKQLKEKIYDLESQLEAAHRKRASIVEAQQSDFQETAEKRVSPTAKVGSVPDTEPSGYSCAVDQQDCTDISPALAYQPSKKLSQSSGTLVPDPVDKLTGSSANLGVPETELLDSTAAKSKAEAVKQSQVMTARQLPTRRPETEVLIVCHHTVEHAEAIRSHAGIESGFSMENRRLEVHKAENGSITSPSKSTTAASSPATPRKIITAPGFLLKRHSNKDLEASREAEIPHALEVMQWSCDDVCKFLKALGLEKYIPEFTVNRIDGSKFLQLEGARLKIMGVQNHSDRSLLKKRIKEIKNRIEKERKAIEKESRQMAKLGKKTSRR